MLGQQQAANNPNLDTSMQWSTLEILTFSLLQAVETINYTRNESSTIYGF
jgi:hypothetical protein